MVHIGNIVTCGKEFRFSFMFSRKPLETFKQQVDMLCFAFSVTLADSGRNNCRGDGQQYRKPWGNSQAIVADYKSSRIFKCHVKLNLTDSLFKCE